MLTSFVVQLSISATPMNCVLLTSSRCRDRKCTPWAKGGDVDKLCVKFVSATAANLALAKRPVQRKCTPWYKDSEATRLVQFAMDSNPDDLQTDDEEIGFMDCPNSVSIGSIGVLRCRERKATPWSHLAEGESSDGSAVAEELRLGDEVELTVPKFKSHEHVKAFSTDSEDLNRSQIDYQHSSSIRSLLMCCAPSHTSANEVQIRSRL